MKRFSFILAVLLFFVFSVVTVFAGTPPAVSVLAIDGLPSIAQVGSNFTVVPTIVNNSEKVVKATINYYLINNKKRALGNQKIFLRSGEEWSGNVILKVPKKTTEGMYYLGICVKKSCMISATQIQIVKILPPPPPPPQNTCTDYMYSLWSACGQNGQQTRIVLNYIPQGCSGNPATPPTLMQECPPPPPPVELFTAPDGWQLSQVATDGNTIVSTGGD